MLKYILGLLFMLLIPTYSNAAMDFEEANNGERVECGNVDLSAYDTASFSLWFIRESAATVPRMLCSAWNSGYDQNWALMIDDDTEPSDLEGRLRTSTGQSLLEEPDVIYDDILYFYCMTYDGSDVRLYLDGELVDTDSRTGNITNTDSPDTVIGTDSYQITTRQFDGIIEDVRIYNRALSPAEVATIYSARGRDSINYGLLHRWLLNEQSSGVSASGSNTVKDMIGQNHGTPQLTPVYVESKLKFKREAQ